MYCFGVGQEVAEQDTLFVCTSDKFPMTYLGIPIQFRKLRNMDLRNVKETFRRLCSWKCKHLSRGVSNTDKFNCYHPTNVHGLFFVISRGVLKKLDYFSPNFIGRVRIRTGIILSLNGASYARRNIGED